RRPLAAAAEAARGDRRVLRAVGHAGELREPLPACVPRTRPGVRRRHAHAARARAAAARGGIRPVVRHAGGRRRARGAGPAGDPELLRAVQCRIARRRVSVDRAGRRVVDADEAGAVVSYGLQPFCDHLALERGLSSRTVEAYRRDLERLVLYLATRGVARPADVTATDLREFVYHLKEIVRAHV